MALEPNVLRKIAALDLPVDKLTAILGIIADVQESADEAAARAEAEAEEKRAKDRARKREKKEAEAFQRNSAEFPRNVHGISAENSLPPDPPQDKVSPTPPSKLNPPYIPPTLGDGRRERARDLEARMRGLMETEPVVVAMDFHHISALLEDPNITDDDAIAGCKAAMADPTFRPKSWRQLVGWVRGAAKDRLGEKLKQRPQAVDRNAFVATGSPPPPSRPQFPGDTVVDIVDPGPVAASILRSKIDHWRNTGEWPERGFGRPPGAPGCYIPSRFLIEEVA